MRELLPKLRERAEPVLRIVCLVLAGIIVYELAGVILHWNPFRGVTVPALPALAVSTNNASAGHPALPLGASMTITAKPTSTTNTNTTAGANILTNLYAVKLATNATPLKTGTNQAGTNVLTPASALASGVATGVPVSAQIMNHPGMMPHGMRGMGGMPGMPGNDLSPALQAQVSRVVDSEIFGPVIHPVPMALLGIAGDVAFLRSSHGQTGLVKEGDTLDDIKLVRIGTNRVLVEQDGQKKELTMFSGYGGESLLPKEDTNENHQP